MNESETGADSGVKAQSDEPAPSRPPASRPLAAKVFVVPAGKKQRPSKPLPTDRVNFQKQKDALNAYAVLNETKRAAVTTAEVGPVLKLNATTAGLMNTFFLDTGLLQKVEGGFVPSDEVKAYALARQWEEDFPGHKLRPRIAETWFAQLLLPHLRLRSMEEKEALGLLSTTAGAEPKYRPQLLTLLDYLELAGLVEREGSLIRAAKFNREDAPAVATPPQVEPIPPASDAAGTSKVVNLKSGGTLRISATLDLFSLSPTDRTFVFSLIDKLEEYEAGSRTGDAIKRKEVEE